MAGKEYTIVDGILFNGARDNDGGIWVRLADDDDHRILSAAVTKQIKNTEAAKGTLSALDPNAPHLLDDILATLNRVLASVNGARPASAQLAGTPIGDALTGGATKGKGKRGGKKGKGDDKVAGSIEGGDATAPIDWADDVPSPRPRVGDAFWTALGFANEVPTFIREVLGYDNEHEHFVVMIGALGEKAAIVWNADWSQWIGMGVQPSGPETLSADLASTAVKELVAALRAGPARLEDSQFEAAAAVAVALLAIVAKANDREDEIRTEVEYIDEYRTLDANAAELAGGIEYDLNQAVSGESAYSIVGTEPGPGAEVEREREPAAPRKSRKRTASAAASPKKPAAKKAASKTGGKRKR